MISYTVTTSLTTPSDLLIVPVFDQKNFPTALKQVDAVSKKELSRLWKSNDVSGTAGSSTLFFSSHKQVGRILVLGLGDKKDMTVRRWDEAIGGAVMMATKKKWSKLSLLLTDDVAESLGATVVGREIATATEIANYSFDSYKKKESRSTQIKKVAVIATKQKKDIKGGLDAGKKIGQAMSYARDLGNTPPSDMTPARLAREAQTLGKLYKKVTVTVFNKKKIKDLKMGCLLGVSQGSILEPKFVIVEYNGTTKKEKPTVLVGKGITFDSGGLSLKPANYMTDMKFDMLGAGTVLGTIHAAAALGIKKRIIGLVPTCENMPSGTSYRPDDVLVNMEGKSVEIGNTDAEGRLILSDALAYAKKFKPKEVIDFATLTGACVVAIGENRAGLFSNEDAIVSNLRAAATETGELIWPLPLGDDFTKQMKSDVADIKNISNSRYGGASTAAAFLEFFTKDDKGVQAYPWAHFDLSNAYDMGGKPYRRSGATGNVIQTMVAYLQK